MVERLRRRSAALERQLDSRIGEVAALKERLAERDRQGDVVLGDIEVMRAKAAEYDALMATLTMRALRRPREWYSEALRRIPSSKAAGMRGRRLDGAG